MTVSSALFGLAGFATHVCLAGGFMAALGSEGMGVAHTVPLVSIIFYVAGIMADGAIAACPNLPPWMNQGNLLTDDFVQVWETRYDIFRNREWTRQGPCEHCNQWQVCRGNSLHLWNADEGRPAWCHYKILNP